MSTEELTKMLQDMVPKEHLDFAHKILIDHGVPLQEEDEENTLKLLGWNEATATPQVEIALQHPKMTLFANALGTPPPDMIEHIHAAGRKVAALCGSPYQALKHANADVDIIIAQGGEGGGSLRRGRLHRVVAPGGQGRRARPVLAAGGIGSGEQIAAALALGCQGAWSGSQWMMVEEDENTPVQQQAYIDASSRDTVRSRSFTGKPCRMLKNDWTEAWADPETPDPLGMPLQYIGLGTSGSPRPTSTRTRPSTWRSTRSVRSSGSSRRREDRGSDRALGERVPRRHPAPGLAERGRGRRRLTHNSARSVVSVLSPGSRNGTTERRAADGSDGGPPLLLEGAQLLAERVDLGDDPVDHCPACTSWPWTYWSRSTRW